jgi:hypothetical protein
VSATVPGDSSGPGYTVAGAYYEGIAQYRCVQRTHTNTRAGHSVIYTDTLVCQIANIQTVQIHYHMNGRTAGGSDYIGNPLAP